MTIAILSVIAAMIFYLLLILPTQWLKVEHVHYWTGIQLRALQISDIHVERLRISPRRLSEVIEEANPDVIFLTGDFTQKSRHLPAVRRYIQRICLAGIPVYAVLGNHDHRLNASGLAKLLEIMESFGVRVLNNESVDLGDYQLVGIDDYGSEKSRVEDAFKQVTSDKPIIVLTHNPNIVLDPLMKRPYTYLMAGHLHGMQFHIPFLFRFVNKGKLVADGIYQGLHRTDYGSYYISKGIGQAGPNARFLVRSEVTIHEL
ncbi:metallophosphoesterase [Paenibacillus sp. GCM10023252]|uniref:metallophosphoesterase n=1 Tax=Paenibacillus sp. GCM10023252 TaxID=3252649 RepID=UPI00361CCC0B